MLITNEEIKENKKEALILLFRASETNELASYYFLQSIELEDCHMCGVESVKRQEPAFHF
jgi:hypothetical protein